MPLFAPPRGHAPMHRRDRRALQVVGALAALLLVTGLVVRGSIGLYSGGGSGIVEVDPETGAIVGGGVQLIPTGSVPLFDGVELTPGEDASACLGIEHRGEVSLTSVHLQLPLVEGPDELLRAVEVQLERGTGVGAGCEGFVAEDATTGTLQELRDGATGWSSWAPHDGDRAVYRVTLSLPDGAPAELQGARGAVGFRWVATAEPTGTDLFSRALMLLAEVARDALLPLLLLIVVAVLFLGIQDRIDRRDPKLALAAVIEEPEPFLAANDLSSRYADRPSTSRTLTSTGGGR
jgi:hypothetical protein